MMTFEGKHPRNFDCHACFLFEISGHMTISFISNKVTIIVLCSLMELAPSIKYGNSI